MSIALVVPQPLRPLKGPHGSEVSLNEMIPEISHHGSEVSLSEMIPRGRVQQHHTPAVHQLVFAKQCFLHLPAGAPCGLCDPVG
jgi:hypothetical protein